MTNELGWNLGHPQGNVNVLGNMLLHLVTCSKLMEGQQSHASVPCRHAVVESMILPVGLQGKGSVPGAGHAHRWDSFQCCCVGIARLLLLN